MNIRPSVKYLLAISLILFTIIEITITPTTIPSSVGLGLIFLLPALLGVAALFSAISDGFSIESGIIGAIAAITLGTVVWSVYSVHTAEQGGVFFGALFILAAGNILAFAVLAQAVLHQLFPDGISIRDEIDHM